MYVRVEKSPHGWLIFPKPKPSKNHVFRCQLFAIRKLIDNLFNSLSDTCVFGHPFSEVESATSLTEAPPPTKSSI